MDIFISEVKTRADLKTFIYLPEKIHKGHTNWVHPYYRDDHMFFDAKKNKYFNSCETVMALAWEGKKPVGRIMGIINPSYNQRHGEANARFCFMECYKDIRVAASLLGYIEDWARARSMTKLVGPLGFSDKDPQGMLMEGFEEKVLIATNYNFPWMNDFLVELGFSKETDLVGYKVIIPDETPEYLTRVYQRVMERNDLVMHEFTSRKEIRPWIMPVCELINESYAHIYGFAPLTEHEMNEFADRYLPLLNPLFIKLITSKEGELLAFVISMPELSDGMRKAKGRLFPIGWFHILRASRNTKLLTMLLGAIKESYRGKGLDSILGIKLLDSARKAKMKVIDSHLILENNQKMRAEYERINGLVHKRYRIYRKELQA